MDTMITQETQPMEELTDEQQANIKSFESKYKQKTQKQKGIFFFNF
jgi:hypothetical protein